MDAGVQLEDLAPNQFTTSSGVIYGFITIYLLYQGLVYFDVPILSPAEILWNALVYIIPTRLLLDHAKRQELVANGMLSQTHAAKGEALRRMFGLGTAALTHKVAGGEGIMRKMSLRSTDTPTTDAPPGLGNWDNSCYQNSVLQGLASLGTLRKYLEQSRVLTIEPNSSTSSTLYETLAKLIEPTNNGKQLWTPAKLKSMSSWQQQDAQEYFSKIMEELDKDAAKAAHACSPKIGLEGALRGQHEVDEQQKLDGGAETDTASMTRNPVEGYLAQRVACTRCGYSEGLSMIPFNCLTVPLGADLTYELGDCLEEYTKLEEINDVDCARCTLLRAETQLSQMLPEDSAPETCANESSIDPKVLSLPPELRTLVAKRLQAIQQALDDDDLSDKTLRETCQIPKKAHVSSTKTRQAVIGRAPQSLVVHVNRSVFDEITGVQRKNYANVRYPLILDLQAWMLGAESDSKATQSMLLRASDGEPCRYRLQAVVTHYGRHENGHYICYRRHPIAKLGQDNLEGDDRISSPDKWWRLSDEDVSAVSETDLLAQGGVFMLFYEREDSPCEQQRLPIADVTPENAACTTEAEVDETVPPLPTASDANTVSTSLVSEPELATHVESTPDRPQLARSPPSEDLTSTGATTEDESEAKDVEEHQPNQPVVRVPSPSLLRTSRAQEALAKDGGFGSAFRAVAAT